MKKKELLQLPVLPAGKTMINVAKEDSGICIGDSKTVAERKAMEAKYRRYYRAKVHGEILKVAVFLTENLAAENTHPTFEIFLSKKEKKYLTFDYYENKWREAKIDHLGIFNYYWRKTQEEWQSESDRKLVNEYFETGLNLNIYRAVLEFQNGIKETVLNMKHRRETEKIDEVMREVPDIPKDFEKWVAKNCFKEIIFYMPERRGKWQQMYCTHCNTWMDAPSWPDRPEHGKETVCPKCKAKAIYKSWNKQKYVSDEADVAVLQKLKDGSGYILRKFSARLKRQHDRGWEKFEMHLSEYVRSRLTLDFREAEYFEYGEYKKTGVYRWCHNIPHGYYYGRCFGYALMYTPNLKRELRDREFKNMNLKRVFRGAERKSVNPASILRILDKNPYLEYLEKSGLYRIMGEVINRGYDRGVEELLDKNKKRIHEVLQLDKQRFQRLRKWDGDSKVLLALRLEAETGGKLTDENIRFILDEEVNMKDVSHVIKETGMNLQKTLNYFQRQMQLNGWKFDEARRFYADYINMARARGMDITDEIVCKQPKMKQFHDQYLEEKNRENNTKRDNEVDEKFKNIKEISKKCLEHFGFETEELIMLAPRAASDITKEGRLQHHCVGASDNYLDKMNREKTFILFLRKKESVETPYYTLEVNWDGKVIQWYGAYDRKPDEKKVGNVLKKWEKEIKERVQKEKATELVAVAV